jgi:hypothetical protein
VCVYVHECTEACSYGLHGSAAAHYVAHILSICGICLRTGRSLPVLQSPRHGVNVHIPTEVSMKRSCFMIRTR